MFAPHDPVMHALLGDCYRALGNWPEARTAYQSAIQWNPSSSGLHHSLGMAHYELQEYAPAATHLRTALTVRKDDLPTLRAAAKSLRRTGMLSEAVEISKRILALDPRDSGTYNNLGISDAFHPLSHHQNNPASLEKLSRINLFHIQLLAYYLEKLRATQDGESNLLDQLVLLYGSGMGDSNLHDPRDLPILLLGGGAGTLKGGRHLQYAKETKLTNLYLTLLNKVGVPAEHIGDSTGAVEHLFDA